MKFSHHYQKINPKSTSLPELRPLLLPDSALAKGRAGLVRSAFQEDLQLVQPQAARAAQPPGIPHASQDAHQRPATEIVEKLVQGAALGQYQSK